MSSVPLAGNSGTGRSGSNGGLGRSPPAYRDLSRRACDLPAVSEVAIINVGNDRDVPATRVSAIHGAGKGGSTQAIFMSDRFWRIPKRPPRLPVRQYCDAKRCRVRGKSSREARSSLRRSYLRSGVSLAGRMKYIEPAVRKYQMPTKSRGCWKLQRVSLYAGTVEAQLRRSP